MKKLTTYILLILLLIPINIYAYSNKIIIGGETIGIEIHSNGVYIVGFYNVNGKNIAEKAGFQKGDIIQEVNNNKITNINSLNKIQLDYIIFYFSNIFINLQVLNYK